MFTIEGYNKQILNLTNSLVIKSLDAAIAMNKGVLYKTRKEISSDKTTWKYFLNLAGRRHETNSDIKIRIIETGTDEPISAKLLSKYTRTREVLREYTDVYLNLINEYPDDILFINGCLFPVDMNKAIEAKDGTILNYNKDLVEYTEYNLIPELQEFVYGYFTRWLVSAYTVTDELYLPAMLAILYANIPTKIMNIRLSNINTNAAHSFHIEHFFRSNLDIWEHVSVLSQSTRYWLYKNLKSIIKHAGKNTTFDKLLQKLCDDNNIRTNRYVIRKENIKLRENTEDLHLPVYNTSESAIVAEPLTQKYRMEASTRSSVSDFLYKELTSNTSIVANPDNYDYIANKTDEYVQSENKDNVVTKAIEVVVPEAYKIGNTDTVKMVLDYYLHYVARGTPMSYVVSFADPNTKTVYNLSHKQAILFLIKAMLGATNNMNAELKEISYHSVLWMSNGDDADTDGALRLKQSYGLLYDDKLSDGLIDKIAEVYPKPLVDIPTTVEFKAHMDEIGKFMEYVWLLDANSESMVTSAAIKFIMYSNTINGIFKLTDSPYPKSIDELIEIEGLSYDLPPNSDYIASFTTILSAMTGLSLETEEVRNNNGRMVAELLSRLTSYTVQVLTNTTTKSESIKVLYNGVSVFRSNNGIVKVLGGEIIPYVIPAIGLTEGIANDHRDDPRFEYVNINMPSMIVTELGQNPIKGWMELYYGNDDRSVPPTTIQIIRERYKPEDLQDKDIFLLGLTGKIEGLDDNPFINNTSGTHFEDNMDVDYQNTTTIKEVRAHEVEWPIQGVASDIETPGEFRIAPRFQVTIEGNQAEILPSIFEDKFLKDVLANISLVSSTGNVMGGGNRSDHKPNVNLAIRETPTEATSSEFKPPIEGVAMSYDGINSSSMEPTVTIQLENNLTPVYPNLFKDDFLKGLTAKIEEPVKTLDLRSGGGLAETPPIVSHAVTDKMDDINLVEFKPPIEGVAVLEHGNKSTTTPEMTIQLDNKLTPAYPSLFVDNFLLGLTADIVSSNKEVGSGVDMDANLHKDDTQVADLGNTNAPNILIIDAEPVPEGLGEDTSGIDIVNLTPTFTIDVEDK